MLWKVNSNDKDKKEEYVDIGDVFKNKDTKKMEEFLNFIADQEKKKDDLRKELVSNYDYIKWIEEFTFKFGSFENDVYPEYSELVSSQDVENISYLQYFYEAIDKYAGEHSINPYVELYEDIDEDIDEEIDESDYENDLDKIFSKPFNEGFCDYYKIFFNGIGYEIGVWDGKKRSFFCRKVKINNEKEFINFDNIVNNVNVLNAEGLNKQLDKLSNMLVSLHEKGISKDIMMNCVYNTLESLNYKEELGESRKLKRE